MKIGRRALLTGALALGCDRGDRGTLTQPTPTGPLPKARVVTLKYGYGVVNHWHQVSAGRLAEALINAGCTLTEIEWLPWPNLVSYPSVAQSFIQRMNDTGINVLISLVNTNAPGAKEQPTSWFTQLVNEALNAGAGNLLLGVSEPDGSAKLREWEQIAKDRWQGQYVANGVGGRGTPSVTSDYIDWHHCTDITPATVRRGPYINSTDCTPLINPGPARAKAMATVCLDANTHYMVYDFNGTSIDVAVIGALGEALQERS